MDNFKKVEKYNVIQRSQRFVNKVIKSLISSCTHVEVQIVPVVGFKLLHVKLNPGRLPEQNDNADLN